MDRFTKYTHLRLMGINQKSLDIAKIM